MEKITPTSLKTHQPNLPKKELKELGLEAVKFLMGDPDHMQAEEFFEAYDNIIPRDCGVFDDNSVDDLGALATFQVRQALEIAEESVRLLKEIYGVDTKA